MRLGLHLGYWGATPPTHAAHAIAEAERLGYDSIWTAEAYSSDALTPLAFWGAATQRVRLGTNLAQVSARTPTALAMAAMTLDHLSGGRVVLGIGVSGPQVVEGWYGQPFARPLRRTREYVQIVRDVLERKAPVASDGPDYPLPYPGGTGLGRPLRSITHPLRADIPILLGAEGPKNVALAAEIADGWFPGFFSPSRTSMYVDWLAEGFARPEARHTADTFEVLPSVMVVIDDDVDRAADQIRPMVAFYIGGMGAKSANYHFDMFVRMGYEAEAHAIQSAFLAGDRPAAVAAVPTKMLEEIALLGPVEKIRDELEAWKASIVTTMIIGMSERYEPDKLRIMAELVL